MSRLICYSMVIPCYSAGAHRLSSTTSKPMVSFNAKKDLSSLLRFNDGINLQSIWTIVGPNDPSCHPSHRQTAKAVSLQEITQICIDMMALWPIMSPTKTTSILDLLSLLGPSHPSVVLPSCCAIFFHIHIPPNLESVFFDVSPPKGQEPKNSDPPCGSIVAVALQFFPEIIVDLLFM